LSSDAAPRDPEGRTLKQILVQDASAYLCGHAHAVGYLSLAEDDVIPARGPIHGRVRELNAPAPLQVCNGTASEVHRKSAWNSSCYYVARIAGFSVLSIENSANGFALSATFFDCRTSRPKAIYGLRLPLRDLSEVVPEVQPPVPGAVKDDGRELLRTRPPLR
jgi:hypothetical protein